MMNWTAAGPKLFFPSTVFTLIRSGLRRTSPATQTFRVPLHLTKLDIKAYLEGLYGLPVQSVETTIFLGRVTKNGTKRMPDKKNAVVTFDEAAVAGFSWPAAPAGDALKYPLDRKPEYPRMKKK